MAAGHPAGRMLVLPPETAAVSQARKFVRSCCEAVGVVGDPCDAAVLLASETVTNAFVHGRSEARLAVSVRDGCVRIEVGDDNSRHPRIVEADVEALDGRGLTIMNALASQWGVRDDQVGKTVWFEVRCD